MAEKRFISGRVTRSQKTKLLEFMRSHKSVGRGQYSAAGGSRSDTKIWETIAKELNDTGCTKTPGQWKRTWIDWKANVKKQYLKLRSQKNSDTDHKPKLLDGLDLKILNFIDLGCDAKFSDSEWEDNDVFDVAIDPIALPASEATEGLPIASGSSSHLDDLEEESNLTEPTTSKICQQQRKDGFRSYFEATPQLVEFSTLNNQGDTMKEILKTLQKQNIILENVLKELKEIKGKFP